MSNDNELNSFQKSRRNIFKTLSAAAGAVALTTTGCFNFQNYPGRRMTKGDLKIYSSFVHSGEYNDVLADYREHWKNFSTNESIADEVLKLAGEVRKYKNEARKIDDNDWKSYTQNMYSALAGIHILMKEGDEKQKKDARDLAGEQDLAAIVQNVGTIPRKNNKKNEYDIPIIRVGDYWILSDNIGIITDQTREGEGGVFANLKILYGDKNKDGTPEFEAGYDFGRINLRGKKVMDLFKKADNLR